MMMRKNIDLKEVALKLSSYPEKGKKQSAAVFIDHALGWIDDLFAGPEHLLRGT